MKIFEILTNPQNKLLPYCQFILLACVILFSMPILVMSIPDGGLDASWKVALHKAYICGMVHGRDILFTYGPVGFLTLPIFVSRNSWLYSATYTLLVYALTLFSFSLYVRKAKTNLINTGISAFIFIIVFRAMFSGSDFGLPLSIFIFSYIYATGHYRPTLLFPIAFLCSVLPFIKFSSGITGVVSALMFLSILLWDRRYKESLIFVFSGLGFFVVLSLFLIGTPKNTVLYLIGSLQISGGYSEAMTFVGDKGQLIFAGFAWLCYISLFTYNAFKKDKYNLIFLSFSIGLLFVSFKHGFVRQDLHVLYFYSTWLLVCVLYYLKSYHRTKVVAYTVLLFTLALLYQYLHISTGLSRYTGIPVLQKLENLHRSFNLLRGLGGNQANIRQYGKHQAILQLELQYNQTAQ
jgi:hypothetical protein